MSITSNFPTGSGAEKTEIGTIKTFSTVANREGYVRCDGEDIFLHKVPTLSDLLDAQEFAHSMTSNVFNKLQCEYVAYVNGQFVFWNGANSNLYTYNETTKQLTYKGKTPVDGATANMVYYKNTYIMFNHYGGSSYKHVYSSTDLVNWQAITVSVSEEYLVDMAVSGNYLYALTSASSGSSHKLHYFNGTPSTSISFTASTSLGMGELGFRKDGNTLYISAQMDEASYSNNKIYKVSGTTATSYSFTNSTGGDFASPATMINGRYYVLAKVASGTTNHYYLYGSSTVTFSTSERISFGTTAPRPINCFLGWDNYLIVPCSNGFFKIDISSGKLPSTYEKFVTIEDASMGNVNANIGYPLDVRGQELICIFTSNFSKDVGFTIMGTGDHTILKLPTLNDTTNQLYGYIKT